MKWLRRSSHNRYFKWVNFRSPYLFNSTSQATKFLISIISTGVFLSGDAAKFQLKSLAVDSTNNLSSQISNIAINISVKVLDQDFLGSGLIIKHQGDRYIVVTNQHVLRAGEAPYQVQTSDGKIHSAKVLPNKLKKKDNYDLALLEFQANNTYSTAKIGKSAYLEVGERIFAAGFPYNQVENNNTVGFESSQPYNTPKFALKPGRISIVLNKALEQGYQIAYTNDVRKGMSGGALLNIQGEVIGINGKHAYPLWESPEFYQDGSQPCPALQDLITRSSLAIPIEKSIELNLQLEVLQPILELKSDHKSNLLLEDQNLVLKMQTEATEINQSCKNFEQK
ncbi:peptidase S1 and S6 chymotrypsin/Hap [Chondrocystis sp. NIES-4102]|nr:peptidase S1 and S6 chymotrypsin/Hap [Chondrocystis sp. NIES-4102]